MPKPNQDAPIPAYLYARARIDRWGSWVAILLAATDSATPPLSAQGSAQGIADPRLSRDLIERNVQWFSRWIPTTATQKATSSPGAKRR